MRILFTGATSFAGAEFRRRLMAAGHELVSVSRQELTDGTNCRVDLESPDLAAQLPRGDFDALVNFASYVPLDERSANWDDCYTKNVLPMAGLLQWAEARVGRILHASSCAVYGDDKLYSPADEKHPLRPNSAYGVSKYGQEQALAAFTRTSHIPVSILRLGYVYGPHLDPQRGIVKLLERVRDGQSITLTNAKTAGLHLIHVGDIGRIGEAMLTQGEGVYNLTSARHISLLEYVEACMEVVGRRVEVVDREDSHAVVTNSYSMENLNRQHGLQPSVSLTSGVESMVTGNAA